ncbi:hypothetical protein [Priestia taiwanensis]|uniref:Uncharacterized protein n=1 Tax=Priestia taiwanensis TaxID=1347902 RepID=A0A917AZ21_9BACI|nr:hypothetical protein [Priestia taiwanensis]MBM7365045.1 hypothetical protein [Priestia taiwanensis]GGE83655.1 hypothetical protein GCM10007140_36450 [Priestia taiwanensis]
MKKKAKILSPVLLGLTLVITGCTGNPQESKPETKQEQTKEQQTKPSAIQIQEVKPLNALTLQITFAEPLSKDEVDGSKLDEIKKSFAFDNGMSIVNVPQLKIGATSTYVVPVTIQKPGTTYTLSYNGGEKKTFAASDVKVGMNGTKQVTNDTFEIDSLQTDGVVDYANIIEAYKAGRGDQSFQVNDENKDANGKQYQVISSLRDREVTVTSDKGEAIVAKYVPFTQAADRRQAPKFRLPEGKLLTPGVKYTVSSDWATFKNPTFTAAQITPLVMKSAEEIDDKSFQVTLDKDPGMELLAGRSVQLEAEDGSKVQAQYRFSSRKGAVGIFDVKDKTLKAGVKYKVVPTNNWANADGVTLTAK